MSANIVVMFNLPFYSSYNTVSIYLGQFHCIKDNSRHSTNYSDLYVHAYAKVASGNINNGITEVLNGVHIILCKSKIVTCMDTVSKKEPLYVDLFKCIIPVDNILSTNSGSKDGFFITNITLNLDLMTVVID